MIRRQSLDFVTQNSNPGCHGFLITSLYCPAVASLSYSIPYVYLLYPQHELRQAVVAVPDTLSTCSDSSLDAQIIALEPILQLVMR